MENKKRKWLNGMESPRVGWSDAVLPVNNPIAIVTEFSAYKIGSEEVNTLQVSIKIFVNIRGQKQGHYFIVATHPIQLPTGESFANETTSEQFNFLAEPFLFDFNLLIQMYKNDIISNGLWQTVESVDFNKMVEILKSNTNMPPNSQN